MAIVKKHKSSKSSKSNKSRQRKPLSPEQLRERRKINYFNQPKDERGRLIDLRKYTGRVYIGVKGNLTPMQYSTPEKYAKVLERKERSKRAAQIKQGQFEERKPIKKEIPITKTEIIPTGENPFDIKGVGRIKPKDKTPWSERPFVYSKILEQNTGYDETAQETIWNLFQNANEQLKLIRELTREKIGKDFEYTENIKKEVLERRIASAMDVLEEGYLERLSAKYRKDFLENFEFQLEKEDFKELEEAVDTLSDYELLAFLKNMRVDYYAYGLDSLITAYGYERIKADVDFWISRIKTGKGKWY